MPSWLAGWLAVLGCADTPAPANSWTRRHDNEMTVFCRDDDTRYHVVCRDGRWVGRIGSCSNTNSQQGFTHYAYSRVLHYYRAAYFHLNGFFVTVTDFTVTGFILTF